MENLFQINNNWIKLNTVLKRGEIAHNDQFLLLPQYFELVPSADVLYCVCKERKLKNVGQSKRDTIVFILFLFFIFTTGLLSVIDL